MTEGQVRNEAAVGAARHAALPRESAFATAGDPSGRRVAVTVGADVVALLASVIAAAALLPRLAGISPFSLVLEGFADTGPGLAAMVAIVPWTIFVMYGYGLYRSSARSIGGWVLSESLRGITALSSAAWSLLLLLLVVDRDAGALGFIIVFWVAAALVVPVMRWIGRAVFWHAPRMTERTVIVGAGTVGHVLAEKIAKHPEYNLRLMGFLDDGEPLRTSNLAVPVVGRLDDLERVIDDLGVTRVIIAFSRARHQQILDVVRTCADHAVRVNIVPRLFEILSSQTSMDDIEGIPLLDVAQVELGRFNMLVKRAFDLVVGGALTLLFLPLLGTLALLVKIDSRGPAFYRQERMGRGGTVFSIFKLRSMHVDAEKRRREMEALNEYPGPMFKMKRDPRVTRVGFYLRKWSLDELPQLFNVIAGEMSLVGPRPLWVEEAKQCRGWTKKRLDITPGITGLWQVTGRNDVPFDEMVKLDYMYVTGWSVGWDIKILLETIPAVVGHRGAY